MEKITVFAIKRKSNLTAGGDSLDATMRVIDIKNGGKVTHTHLGRLCCEFTRMTP